MVSAVFWGRGFTVCDLLFRRLGLHAVTPTMGVTSGGIPVTNPLWPALPGQGEARPESTFSTPERGCAPLARSWGARLFIGGSRRRAVRPVYGPWEADVDHRGIRLAILGRRSAPEHPLGLPASGRAPGASIALPAEHRSAGLVSLRAWASRFRETVIAPWLADGEVTDVRRGSARPCLIDAATAYPRVLHSFPDPIDAQYGLCKLALDDGCDLDRAKRIAADRVEDRVERRPADPRYAVLPATLRYRLRQTRAACGVVRETLDHVRDPLEALVARLSELDRFSAVGLNR